MQINSASPFASFGAGSIRPGMRPNAALAGAAKPAETAAGQGVGAGITFRDGEVPNVSPETIMQHWGTSNAEADLNTDGIVDGQDLAMALNGAQPAQNNVLGNWGASGENATAGGDLNGDGVVNAVDLALSLNGTGENRSAQLPADGAAAPSDEQLVTNIVDATFAARDVDGDGSLVAKDFVANGAAGDPAADPSQGSKVFERLDLDQSGGVGREELTKALFSELERFREQFPGARPEAFARRWMDSLTTGRPVANYGQFQRMQQLFNGPVTPRSTSQILSARA